jgi:hypothetical protein
MWKPFASIRSLSAPRWRSPFLFTAAFTVGFAFIVAGPCSLARGRDDVAGNVRVPGIRIACYHREARRFTAEIRPSRCEIAGHEGKQRRFVGFPIRGLKWSEWGEFRTEGSRGLNVSKRIAVRVIAFRRVRCADGRTFYSAANVVEPGNGSYFVVRLPTCENPALIN